MNQTQSTDVLSLQGFVQAILGHKIKVFFSFVLVLSMICFYTVYRGRDFESSSKLFIRKGRETVTVDPLASASGQVVSVTDTQDREINSIISIFRNRDLLEQVVDEVGPETILNYQDEDEQAKPKPDSPVKQAVVENIGKLKTFMRESGLLEQVSEREEAVASLRDALSIEAGNGSAVIKVSVKASSPKLAQLLNKKVIDAYSAYHVMANKSSGSYNFLDEQAADLSEQLKAASESLAELKIKNNVLSLGAKKEAMEQRLMSIDNLRIGVTADLAASGSKIRQLQSQLETAINQVHEQLHLTFLTEKAIEASLVAELDELNSQRKLLKTEIESLNSAEYGLTELQRQVDILDGNYRRHVDKLEQVRINKELEDRSISNVNIVQKPSFVDYPIGPGNKLMYVMGLIIAFCFSCGVGVMSEIYRPHQARQASVVSRRRNSRRNRSRSDRSVEVDAPA